MKSSVDFQFFKLNKEYIYIYIYIYIYNWWGNTPMTNTLLKASDENDFTGLRLNTWTFCESNFLEQLYKYISLVLTRSKLPLAYVTEHFQSF